MNRFRWAVCQLDILKRLKPDASIIKVALSDLPKGLDETYNRILLEIPEDSWLSVKHAFRWMVYHNDLYNYGKIPLTTLLQAVKQSITSLHTQKTDQLHDLEALRECCGCLLLVEQDTMNLKPNVSSYEQSTVTFAHYTVKEYLKSDRILKNRAKFFALTQEKMDADFAGIALRQALSMEPHHFPKCCYKPSKVPTYYGDLLVRDFKLYCLMSSLLQLKVWSEDMSSNSTLMELSEAFVNPRNPSYTNLENFDEYVGHQIWREGVEFHEYSWSQDQDTDAAVFVKFLLLSEENWHYSKPHLVFAFANKHTILTILTQQYRIKFTQAGREFEFQGSIPELVGTWTHRPDILSHIFDLISDLGASHFNLSRILLVCMDYHDHRHINCVKSCSVERLLGLGASADGSEGAWVTPLQIAAKQWDLPGIELLLRAGADPNALGGASLIWTWRRRLSINYTQARGASPLHIIKHSGAYRPCCGHGECHPDGGGPDGCGLKDPDESVRERIVTLLLEAGALDISNEGSASA
jgi:hypothetical protein